MFIPNFNLAQALAAMAAALVAVPTPAPIAAPTVSVPIVVVVPPPVPKTVPQPLELGERAEKVEEERGSGATIPAEVYEEEAELIETARTGPRELMEVEREPEGVEGLGRTGEEVELERVGRDVEMAGADEIADGDAGVRTGDVLPMEVGTGVEEVRAMPEEEVAEMVEELVRIEGGEMLREEGLVEGTGEHTPMRDDADKVETDIAEIEKEMAEEREKEMAVDVEKEREMAEGSQTGNEGRVKQPRGADMVVVSDSDEVEERSKENEVEGKCRDTEELSAEESHPNGGAG